MVLQKILGKKIKTAARNQFLTAAMKNQLMAE